MRCPDVHAILDDHRDRSLRATERGDIDAHLATSDNHYYADGLVTLCGDTAATVLMRNVKDIVAGVRGTIIDSRTPPCTAVPRR